MTTDPAGTKPGLAPEAEEQPKPVFIKCKNPNCDSIEAVPFILPGKPGIRMYRCVKCGTTKGVNVGGGVDF